MKISVFYLIQPVNSNSPENLGILVRFQCLTQYTGRHKLVRVIILSDTVILIGLSHFKSQIIT